MDTLANDKTRDQEQKARKPEHPSTATHKSLITRNLRLAYGEVAGEPIPDRFNDLLNKLADAAKEEGSRT